MNSYYNILDKNSPTIDQDLSIEYDKLISDKINKSKDIIERKLKLVAGNSECKVKTSIKDKQTTIEKFKRPEKKYKSILDIPDVLRYRLTVPIQSDFELLIRRIKKEFDVINIDEKKVKDSGYYGAVHVDIVYDELKVEIQICTSNMISTLNLSHELYEKTRDSNYAAKVSDKEKNEMRLLLKRPYDIKEDKLKDRYLSYKRNKQKHLAFLIKMFSKFASLEKFNFVVLQKPLAIGKENEIEQFITDNGATIVSKKKVLINSKTIGEHYKQFADKSFFIPMLKYYVGKFVTIWLVNGDNVALQKMRSNIGSPKATDENSFRKHLVGDSWKEVLQHHKVLDNGIHVSDSKEEGEREAQIWFEIPKLVLEYNNEDINKVTFEVHNFLYKQLDSIPWGYLQYSNTNNETAVKSKPVDIDYRILVPENKLDETVEYIEQHIDGAFFDREGVDERTGAKYKKLEYVFKYGKADIAVVPIDAYKDRIGSGHLVDLLPEHEKREIGRRKEEAWAKGKAEYKKVKQQIQQETKQRFNI